MSQRLCARVHESVCVCAYDVVVCGVHYRSLAMQRYGSPVQEPLKPCRVCNTACVNVCALPPVCVHNCVSLHARTCSAKKGLLSATMVSIVAVPLPELVLCLRQILRGLVPLVSKHDHATV